MLYGTIRKSHARSKFLEKEIRMVLARDFVAMKKWSVKRIQLLLHQHISQVAVNS
jgi:hypothetical protein